MKVTSYERASALPPRWDALVSAADHPFLTRDFLLFLEKTNPCEQRYYLAEEEDLLFVTYRLKLDLFTFTGGFGPKWKVRILGVPLSVSREGFILPPEKDLGPLEEALDTIGEGLTLLLNVPDTLSSSLPSGRTLPSFVLPLSFASADDYSAALKSHYRRRLNKIRGETSHLAVRTAVTEEIRRDLYPLYRAVYDRSDAKLECLSPAYFEAFPSRTQVVTLQGTPVAFYQVIESRDAAYFVLGGFDRKRMDPNALYPYLLHRLVEEAIDGGKVTIDLGQTAGEAKARTGARPVEKRFFLHHPSPWKRWVLRRFASLFSYRERTSAHHVFRSLEKESR